MAARSYYPGLLAAGVRIFEYKPGMMHAKYALVDECFGLVGSANLDQRSLHLNFEVSALLYDAGSVKRLAEIHQLDAQSCEELPAPASAFGRGDEFAAPTLPLAQRLAEGAARLMSPLL